MSPRAAWRLEQLGFEAHDYAGGKSDWLGWGLPYEGDADLVGGHVTREVATATVGESLGAVSDRLAGSRSGLVVVVNDHGVVLGRLLRGRIDGPDDRPVGEAMEEGPTTVRPSEPVDELAHRMQHAGVAEIVVTRSDGRLLGIFTAP